MIKIMKVIPHIWLYNGNDILMLQTKIELTSIHCNLLKFVDDNTWCLIAGVEFANFRRYELSFFIAPFYRNKKDILNIIKQTNYLLKLGEPNVIGLEDVPKIELKVGALKEFGIKITT
jgi:hypothetical protein